jgi:hypothetical protein
VSCACVTITVTITTIITVYHDRTQSLLHDVEMSASYDPEGQGYPQSHHHQPNQQHRQQPRRRRRSLDRSVSPRGAQYSARSEPQSNSYHDTGVPPFDPRRGSQVSQADIEAQNQLAPYDEEKAFAEWCRAYGPEPAAASTFSPTPSQTQIPAPAPMPVPPPPPTIRSYRRHEPADERRRYYEDDMEPYYDDEMSIDRRAAPRRRRRRDSSHSVTDHPGKPESNVKDLGPTLLSGAAGAFLGRKLVGKSALGMVGGAIAGAIGANAGEHLDERKRRKEQQQREERRREERYLSREDDRRRGSRRAHDRYSPPEQRRDTASSSPRHREMERPYRPRRKRYVGSSPEGGYTSM